MISLGLSSITRRIAHGLKPQPEVPPHLLQTVREAAAWCSLETPLRHNLRSPELDPSSTLDIPCNHDDIAGYTERSQTAYRQAVSELVRTRSALLAPNNITLSEQSPLQAGARLLCYYPHETVDDGAAEASSRGIFNIHDAPPWDTWIAYAHDTILCLIPESFTTRAQAGIDQNPVDCIHWATQHELARFLP